MRILIYSDDPKIKPIEFEVDENIWGFFNSPIFYNINDINLHSILFYYYYDSKNRFPHGNIKVPKEIEDIILNSNYNHMYRKLILQEKDISVFQG